MFPIWNIIHRFGKCSRMKAAIGFVKRYRGIIMELQRPLSKSFDGVKVKLGPLEMKIDEASVFAATKIPGEGERWFNDPKRSFNDCG
jgi:hypothetical protein